MSAAFVKLKKDEIFMQKAKPGRGQRVAEQIARDPAAANVSPSRSPETSRRSFRLRYATPEWVW